MDYKAMLHDDITQMQAETKRGELPRALRLGRIEGIIQGYFAATGEWPDAVALERLSDLCLYEELTDHNIHKVAHTEYPFLSEYQFDRRDSRESAVGDAIDNSANDGRRHTKPTRRARSEYENSTIDKKAKIRNKERRKTYHEFTKVQPVIIRKMSN
jgi:hypothetical protein